MRIDVVTIFPEYLAPLGISLLGKARERGLVDLRVHDLRRWATDGHRTVDDAPYGGGPGMVMLAEPWGRALDAVAADGPAGTVPRLVVPTPSGRRFTQAMARELAAQPWLALACGRYEGIDARVVDYAAQRMPVEEVTIGDYVLAGGEAAALVICEAVTRLLPGVLGNSASAADDSFAGAGADAPAGAAMEGMLEGPVFTRPARWRGFDVPTVLLSGDHGAVQRWRRDQALRRTARYRPDLAAGVRPELPAEADRWPERG